MSHFSHQFHQKGTSLPPWINHWDVKWVKFHLKIASTRNIGHPHKDKTCQANFNKLINEAEERVRERKGDNAHCFLYIYNQWKYYTTSAKSYNKKAHSAMISSHNILSNRKTDTWLDKIDCYVDLEESVKWAFTMGRWEMQVQWWRVWWQQKKQWKSSANHAVSDGNLVQNPPLFFTTST